MASDGRNEKEHLGGGCRKCFYLLSVRFYQLPAGSLDAS
jgi:hypothetical protein